jgi:hypothetical protein
MSVTPANAMFSYAKGEPVILDLDGYDGILYRRVVGSLSLPAPT